MLVLVAGGLLALVAILAFFLLRGRGESSEPSSSSSSSASKASGKKEADAAAGAAVQDTRPVISFYVGTQTGTAQKFADGLAREAGRHGFRADVVDLDVFSASKPAAAAEAKARLTTAVAPPGHNPIAVFLVATYGEGDPTENARDFVAWLKDPSHPPTLFSPLRFTVFGLGNRQYEHYNKMGKDVNARLEALGAKRAYKHGEGDDDGSMDSDFLAWKGGFWAAMQSLIATTAANANANATSSSSSEGANGSSTSSSSAGTTANPTLGGGAKSKSSANARNGGGSGQEEGEEAMYGKPEVEWRVVPVPAPTPSSLKEPCGPGDGIAEGVCIPILSSAARAAVVDAAPRSSKPYYEAVPARVAVNRELRQQPGVGLSTRHIELDLNGTGLTYVTADNLYICPDNDPKLVEAVARRLGFTLDEWFVLEPAQPGGATTAGGKGGKAKVAPFPTPCTVRAALTRYCNLTGKVEHNVLEQLVAFAGNAAERKRLARLSSAEGLADFQQWAVLPQRSLAEVFEEFPSISIDLASFFQVIPRLQPRAYTIASSSKVHPHSISVCASVIDQPKPNAGGGGGVGVGASSSRRRLQGVCSNHLLRVGAAGSSASSGAGASSSSSSAAGQSSHLRVYVHPSTFRLPSDPSIPVLLIGPGTGIAPMMAFLQERRHQRQQTGGNSSVGDTLLFFGCRRSTEDYIYERELLSFVADGTLTALHTAFSREQADGKKVYVQNLLEEQGQQVWKYISGPKPAHLYVCGATTMGHDVLKTLEGIVETQGKMGRDAAAKYVRRMQEEHRYVQELWSS